MSDVPAPSPLFPPTASIHRLYLGSGQSSLCPLSLTANVSARLSQARRTWSQQMFVSSSVIINWPPAVTFLPAQHPAAPRRLTADQTASSPASSASSAPGTCRACAGTTGTGTAARSSSSAKTVPSSPATSKNKLQQHTSVVLPSTHA